MIKNIIFDLGGVVLGREYVIHGGVKEINDLFWEDFPEFWKDFDHGLLSQQQTTQALAEKLGCSFDEADEYMITMRNMLTEFPRMVSLIKELSAKGYKLYVLSNMSREFYDYIRRFEVFEYFDGAVISGHELLVKPDTAFYQRLLDRYSLDPAQTLFIDDRQDNIEAARKLGIHTFHYTDPVEDVDKVRQLIMPA